MMEYLSAIDRARPAADPFAKRQWLRAQRYIAEKQITAARIALEALVARDPGMVAGRMLLASVYLDEGRAREAAAQVETAAGMMPDHADVIATTVHCLLRVGEMVAARDCLTRFNAATRKLDGDRLLALAGSYQVLGDHPRALALLERAQAQGFDNPEFRYVHALQLQFNGRVDDARKRLEACLRLGPTCGRALLALARMSKQTPESNHLDYIRAQLQGVERGSEDHAAFEFAQYKELEDLGRFDEAFAALERGNSVMCGRRPPDSAREADALERLAGAVTADFIRGPGAVMGGPVPIFVVGMPRSGTTLLDRLLDNHPDVVSTGERTDFPRQLRWVANLHGDEVIDAALVARLCGVDHAELGRRYLEQTQWRAAGSPYYVDKLPPNCMLLGLVHRALPQAPILHMVRDPMDVCFSNYRALFGDSYAYSYRMDALAAHYASYRKLMEHWHRAMPGVVFDVDYRKLVTDPENTLSAIFAHCGLRQIPGCSDLTRNATAVNTLSSAQIREPIHARYIGAWRRYAKQLAPLVSALQCAGFASADAGP